ncbi:MAG: hypothetical protein ABI591_08595 [Kofleriaceae bacterium]
MPRALVVATALLIAGCKPVKRAHVPDAVSVTTLIERGRADGGARVKLEATVHAIISGHSDRLPELSWQLQLVDDEGDYSQHKDHTVTCSLASKPAVQPADLVVVEGTVHVWMASGTRVSVEDCTIQSVGR